MLAGDVGDGLPLLRPHQLLVRSPLALALLLPLPLSLKGVRLDIRQPRDQALALPQRGLERGADLIELLLQSGAALQRGRRRRRHGRLLQRGDLLRQPVPVPDHFRQCVLRLLQQLLELDALGLGCFALRAIEAARSLRLLELPADALILPLRAKQILAGLRKQRLVLVDLFRTQAAIRGLLRRRLRRWLRLELGRATPQVFTLQPGALQLLLRRRQLAREPGTLGLERAAGRR
mmetsp:Transcript_13542/g.38782  ORF Transcript_13542/g.38782 Transcript_13542/m.38782 type:complete len:234 (-) Transcript_13542:307-1008(-)